MLSVPLQGAVLVELKSAKDLPAADNNGLSDPYCKLLLAGTTKKSVIQYDTLSPVWNEKHDFVKVRITLPAVPVLKIDHFIGPRSEMVSN